MTDYQKVTFIILAIFSLFFVFIGFLLIEKESIGAGFIFAGGINFVFGSFFASLASIMSSYSSLLLSNPSKTIDYTNYIVILFSLIGLVITIIFANLKLEKNKEQPTIVLPQAS